MRQPADNAHGDPPATPVADHPEMTAVPDVFAAYRTEPEQVWHIPAPATPDDTTAPLLRLGIAALGGGTPGRRYADNDWIYGLWLDNRLLVSGADLRCGAVAQTHDQMAALLADHCADDAALDLSTRRRLAAWSRDDRRPGGPS